MAEQLEIIKSKIIPILKRPGAIRAGLFGSLVTGRLRRNSDIDILVELPPTLSLLDLASLKLDLEDALDRVDYQICSLPSGVQSPPGHDTDYATDAQIGDR